MTTSPEIRRRAQISPDGTYRWLLSRSWPIEEGVRDGAVVWIMLNPSTADGESDDPTIRRCMSFTRAWGYRRMEVVNLFAYRATNPRDLADARLRGVDVVGVLNRETIRSALCFADLTVAAWGAHALAWQQMKWMFELAEQTAEPLHCLGATKQGAPRHPLYVAGTTELVPYPRPGWLTSEGDGDGR